MNIQHLIKQVAELRAEVDNLRQIILAQPEPKKRGRPRKKESENDD